MLRWIYSITASLLLLAAGLVHGFWTDRWAHDTRLSDAAERLDQIPLKIGDWEGVDLEVKANQTAPGVTGSLQRRYTNTRTGATVVMALVNGRPGPVATHTPEACYGAAGFQVGARMPIALDTNQGSAHFWTSDAMRTRVTEVTKVRIFWAWNGGEGWIASHDARREFSRSRYPILHKLYVLRDLNEPNPSTAEKDDACIAFLEILLPVLETKLFAQDG